MVTVRVPATTANIGPGFDSLGCALALYATVSFEECPSGLYIKGCDEEFSNEDNLMVYAYKKTLEKLKLPFTGLKIEFTSDIPMSRGLGSSAALIVAGATGANANHGNTLTKHDILCIANEIEGHPDNVAPAIFGGLTASFLHNDLPLTVRYNIHKNIKFCILIPEFMTSTHEARKVLPKQVPYADAVFNLSRAVVLCKALEENNQALITLSIEDKLHQPYRKTLIHEYDAVENICKNFGGYAFFISGSGPTCIVLIKDDNAAMQIQSELSYLKYKWQVHQLPVDLDGAVVVSAK